ncbi:MAG: hypothetical protein E6Q97_12785 [Desulfurellales bacterium]|nr:MAG: hypothetical protein E6Q97_12785 [Desulfurellales bacterium]
MNDINKTSVFVVIAEGDDVEGQEPTVFARFEDALDFATSDHEYDDGFEPNTVIDHGAFARVDYGDYAMVVFSCQIHKNAL